VSRWKVIRYPKAHSVPRVLRELRVQNAEIEPYDRPTKRSECPTERPCPFVSCRYHLAIDVTRAGGIKFNFPDLSLDEMQETCALDVAGDGENTTQRIADLLNVERQRIDHMIEQTTASLTEKFEEHDT